MRQIYRSLDAPALKKDCARIDKMIAGFAETYKDTIEFLAPEELAAAIVAYEEIEAARNRILCYAELVESDDRRSLPALAPLKAWLAASDKEISFFESEIADLPEAKLLRSMTDPIVAQYAPWIARVRAGAEHVLDEATEKKIDALEKDITDVQKSYAGLLQSVRVSGASGETATLDDAHNALSSLSGAAHDDARLRLAAALKTQVGAFADLYNRLMQDDLEMAGLRRYTRPDHETHLENGLSDETIDMMRQKTKASYPSLSQRFYSWKAGMLGVQQMTRAQSQDSLPGLETPDGYDFQTAKNAVFSAFGRLSPTLEKLARKFFTSHHVDAQPRPFKEENPFAMPAGPDDFPYVLVNFRGELNDVVCGLGHELGHGVHFALSEKTRGFFLSENTTILCETASVFAEMIVYDELMRQEKDPARKRALAIERFEGVLMNALQQQSWFDFELRVRDARKSGPLDAEQISDLWVATQQDFYGPAVKLDDYDRYYWMTVPHFFDTPFYVYSYAVAQNIVNGLYQQYQDTDKRGPAGRAAFAEKYIELLRGGVTKDIYHALRPFNLDVETPEFWDKSQAVMASALDRIIDPAAARQKRKPSPDPGAGP